MARKDDGLERVRGICLALPDTRETPTWGKPHFRVGDKIFCGYGGDEHGAVIGFKLEKEHARELVLRPGFRPAPYVGHKGWVELDLRQVSNWGAVRELVLESYRLIAPKRTLAKLAGTAAEPSAKAPAAKRRRAAAPTRKPTAKTVRKRTARKA
jgi:predicted DNA-binding protein (MmcQ/YjbR family)